MCALLDVLICRCTSVAWVPQVNGFFVVAHADGNGKDATVDPSFPLIKDPTQFSIAHAKSSKSNPISRWHICQGSINRMTFSVDGTHLAVVGRDGFLRVFDYQKELLVFGGKSYYGAILCCAWSMDGKYILTGGEDDLVQVWSMEDRKVIAWGEGHNSWVSGVAFDPYWSPPSSDRTGENVMYRFGSVGQDTQLLLWDFSMDEIVVPLRRCPPGGSPTYSAGSQSAQWDSVVPLGSLQPAPSMRDVPKLSPLVAHRVYTDPLSDLVFTKHSILTACREGHVKVWKRPVSSETILGDSETASVSSLPGTEPNYDEEASHLVSPMVSNQSKTNQLHLGVTGNRSLDFADVASSKKNKEFFFCISVHPFFSVPMEIDPSQDMAQPTQNVGSVGEFPTCASTRSSLLVSQTNDLDGSDTNEKRHLKFVDSRNCKSCMLVPMETLGKIASRASLYNLTSFSFVTIRVVRAFKPILAEALQGHESWEAVTPMANFVQGIVFIEPSGCFPVYLDDRRSNSSRAGSFDGCWVPLFVCP
uniref:Uncharacterized protein n=1 Tax=Chenopodium quinoa TaxID=63459 RepID=A0A803N318_CHEQI